MIFVHPFSDSGKNRSALGVVVVVVERVTLGEEFVVGHGRAVVGHLGYEGERGGVDDHEAGLPLVQRLEPTLISMRVRFLEPFFKNPD